MLNYHEPKAEKPEHDPFDTNGHIVNPFTGERIYSPERARKIDEVLAERKRRKQTKHSGAAESLGVSSN